MIFTVKNLSNRLHFSIGCYDCRRTPGSRHSLQLGRFQVLSADHVHRRPGVYHKLSVLQFNCLSLSPVCTIRCSSSIKWIFASVEILEHEFRLQMPLSFQNLQCPPWISSTVAAYYLFPEFLYNLSDGMSGPALFLSYFLELLFTIKKWDRCHSSITRNLFQVFSLQLSFGCTHFGALRSPVGLIVTRAQSFHNMLHIDSAHNRKAEGFPGRLLITHGYCPYTESAE